MRKNHNILLGLIVLLCLMTATINAQQLPANSNTQKNLCTNQLPTTRFELKVPDYARFVATIQAQKHRIKMISFDAATQVAIIQTE